MKRLLLLRHAKSDWSDTSLPDIDRPLSARGETAAPRIANWMAAEGLHPQWVLCSPARRARETWALVRPVLDDPEGVSEIESLYLAGPAGLLGAIRSLPDHVDTALVISHNPGLASLAAMLAGPASKKKPVRRLDRNFPTAALAVIDFDAGSWSDVAAGSGRHQRLVRPRDLE